MKKATLLSLLICVLSFIETKAQTCTVINNTRWNYNHTSSEIGPVSSPPFTIVNRTYFVPALSTIAFNNTYWGLAIKMRPATGGHFVRSSTIEVSSGTNIGLFYSSLGLAVYSFGGTPVLSYINPITGGTCTWVEVYNPTTGEHDVTITIN